jgi:hypothetical protein
MNGPLQCHGDNDNNIFSLLWSNKLMKVANGLAFGLYCTIYFSAVGPTYQPDSRILFIISM